MRTATFLIMSALGMACAHRPAPPAVVETKPAEPRAEGSVSETQAALSEGPSGDPRLGNLALSNAPAAPRAEVAPEPSAASSGNSEAREHTKADKPRVIEPAAPTVATVRPGSALMPPAPEAASKDEADLRARIQRTLLRDASLSFTAKRVRVEVEHGRVTLLGEVRTAHEKTEVEDLVQKVSGVRRVSNRLAIIDQPAMSKATP